MSANIQNSVVLVTGANRGIGRAIAEEALQRGAAKVYAAVRDLGSADPLVEQFGDRVVPVRIDVTDRESVNAAAEQAKDVTIVVNNAGALKTASPLAEDAVDALDFEVRVNVHGLIHMAQAFAPHLKQNGGGAFVQLNSVASLRSFADFATYSASKAASYSITQGLRDKLVEQDTQVVSVHPGPIQTDMASDAGLDDVAEPPSLVAEAIFTAIEKGEFHAWPDSMAKQFASAYATFGKEVVESDMSESPA